MGISFAPRCDFWFEFILIQQKSLAWLTPVKCPTWKKHLIKFFIFYLSGGRKDDLTGTTLICAWAMYSNRDLWLHRPYTFITPCITLSLLNTNWRLWNYTPTFDLSTRVKKTELGKMLRHCIPALYQNQRWRSPATILASQSRFVRLYMFMCISIRWNQPAKQPLSLVCAALRY